MRWLITNRNQDDAGGFGLDFAPLTFWTFNPVGNATNIELRSAWKQRTIDEFRAELITAAQPFPNPIHGYNNNWSEAVHCYDDIATRLFDGPKSLGELISFDWPSKGSLLGYLPDRAASRKTGDDLTNVLSTLYDWMSAQQIAASVSPDNVLEWRGCL